MNKVMSEEDFQSVVAAIVEQFDNAAAGMEEHGIPAFKDPEMQQKCFLRYDRLAEQMFVNNFGQPWAGRENCLWVKAREALRTSQTPMHITISGEGLEESIHLIDHHGNKVISVSALAERLAQESWLKGRMVDFITLTLEDIESSVQPYKILMSEDPALNQAGAKQLLNTVVSMRSGLLGVERFDRMPGWLEKSLSIQSMDESRQRLLELSESNADLMQQIYQELAENAYRVMFEEMQESEFSADQVDRLCKEVANAAAKPTVIVVREGLNLMKSWVEMRKTGQN